MAITLYDTTVRSFLQTLGGAEGFLAKGLAHCRATGLDPAQVVETRLIADMLPFRFQVESLVHHSLGAVEAVQSGLFTFPPPVPNRTYEDLQAMVSQAKIALEAVAPEAVNSAEGREVIFKVSTRAMPFTAEDFLLTFSIPNLQFHATTAYDILRMTGAPIGKLDFLGPMRLKQVDDRG